MSTPSDHSRRSSDCLTPDQLTAIEHATEGGMLIIAKPGSGKTIIAATAICNNLASGHVSRVLIVTTPRIADTVWRSEFDAWEHTHHVTTALASGSLSASARLEAIKSPAQVVITTFNLLPWFKEHKLFESFDGLVIDETTKLTSAGGKHASSLRNAAKRMLWSIGLTGTPVDEGPDKLYMQLLLVDKGTAFGSRKESFLNTWFYPTDRHQRNWELKPHLKDDFYKRAHQSIHVVPDYRQDLPELIENTINISPPQHLIEANNTFIKTSALPGMTSPTAGTDTQKAAQLGCGFYYDDEQNVIWLSEFRIQAAIDLINQTAGNVLVVYNYIPEKERFLTLCPTAEMLTNENIARWNRKQIPVMLLHPKSAGHGVELQHGGSTIIWLSNQWSLDNKNQLNARLWRRGQKENVNVFYFRALGIDDRIEKRLDEKSQHDADFTKGA
jgi:hypothetical protein